MHGQKPFIQGLLDSCENGGTGQRRLVATVMALIALSTLQIRNDGPKAVGAMNPPGHHRLTRAYSYCSALPNPVKSSGEAIAVFKLNLILSHEFSSMLHAYTA